MIVYDETSSSKATHDLLYSLIHVKMQCHSFIVECGITIKIMKTKGFVNARWDEKDLYRE